MMSNDQERLSDGEELRDILSAVTETVPGLLRELRNVLYSKDAAENMADAVATFYKKLVEAGIPKEEALDMARGYMINVRDVFRGVKPGHGMHVHVDDNDDEEDD
jgi:hypothetical protein